jgi:predicted amidohydrolase
VLPEAFNSPGPYESAKKRDHDSSLAPSLMRISKSMGVAFVVGLMDGADRSSRKSTARLLGPGADVLLAHKVYPDGVGGYQSSFYFRWHPYRGLKIATLICNDAAEYGSGYPTTDCHRAAESASVEAESDAILCIPAHYTVPDPREVARSWNHKFRVVVIANSHNEKPSVISAKAKEITPSSDSTGRFFDANEIIWLELPQGRP